MTDDQMCHDLKTILSRLLTQITEHEKGTNHLLPTPTLLLLHIESTALSALQDYPCTSKTSTRAATPWYVLKSIYGAARGWSQSHYKADVRDVIVIIKCTIQEPFGHHDTASIDRQEQKTVRA